MCNNNFRKNTRSPFSIVILRSNLKMKKIFGKKELRKCTRSPQFLSQDKNALSRDKYLELRHYLESDMFCLKTIEISRLVLTDPTGQVLASQVLAFFGQEIVCYLCSLSVGTS